MLARALDDPCGVLLQAHAAAKRAMRNAVVQLRDSQAAEDELMTRGPDLGANPGEIQQDLANRRGALADLQREVTSSEDAVESAVRSISRKMSVHALLTWVQDPQQNQGGSSLTIFRCCTLPSGVQQFRLGQRTCRSAHL